MGRTLDAFRRNWCIWVVLFLSGGIKALVNSIEQPFARSLIHCDEPVTEYSGSRWCGDRLRVIQSGLELSALGQSQENLSTLLLLPFVAVSTGVWGPKVAITVGLLGVIGSVVLFLIACESHARSRTLFALGQFLQGTLPMEYLTSILFRQMFRQPDSDAQADMQLMTYLMFLAGAIFNSGLGDIAQLMEVADYSGVWLFLLVLNVGILMLNVLRMPSERPSSTETGAEAKPVAKLVEEVLSYRTLFSSWVVRILLVKTVVESTIPPFQTRMAQAEMMAYHGWSQKDLTFVLMLPQLFSVKFMPFFGGWALRFGYLFTYAWAMRLHLFSYVLSALTLPFTHRWHLFMTYFLALFSGFMTSRYQVEMRYLDPLQMDRFQNVQWLLNYFLGIWIGPVYVSVFDATAQTYGARVLPGLLCCTTTALLFFIQFRGLYDLDGVLGWGVSLRIQDEGGVKALKLWHTISLGPGHGVGYIGREKYRDYRLEEFLGKKIEDLGGSIYSVQDWLKTIEAMNSTNAQGLEAIKMLDLAQSHAESMWPQDERHSLSYRLWIHLSSHGKLSEEVWADHALNSSLGLSWEQGGSLSSLEQFDALLDALPEDSVIEGLRQSVTLAQELEAKRKTVHAAKQESSVPAPGRQRFLARIGQVGMVLQLSEAVFVQQDPGKDIFHSLLALALWRVAAKKTRVGSCRAVVACWFCLWLGGAGAATRFGDRPHFVNMIWIIHILICPFAVLRYFFELDVDEQKQKTA